MANPSRKIVICGAGIAGIAAAYYLAVEHGEGEVNSVEEGNPLSLTSDKSTEAYRNWWPGPDWAMTAYMNRSIDLLEGIARATGNRMNLNRRGYLFATADASKVSWLQDIAQKAEALGAGPVTETPGGVIAINSGSTVGLPGGMRNPRRARHPFMTVLLSTWSKRRARPRPGLGCRCHP